MRLRDLDAHLIKWRREPASDEDKALNPQYGPDWVRDVFYHVDSLSAAHGIEFICPKGKAEGDEHRIMVFFAGSPVPPEMGKNSKGETVRWQTTGSNLDDLTLSPSIHEESTPCGWHGHVTNGDAA
jgi:hypothetical protein